ncbi:hypothetical protein [Streptomyces sp. ME19-01-6]|uniref:hypothetical protein n=1 Tax=Streptomyces sp. ME19-01-6 TaxID=3028686 RepID=UPI0029AF7E07|nr:hypothetical protein [Streptomyces sp. ME19-01-6]MDX3233455.1 hypothetical protein [Streptomyces sp. ME19-01-6]
MEDAARQVQENRDLYLDTEREKSAQAAKRAVYSAARQAGLNINSGTVENSADEVCHTVSPPGN